MSLYGIMENRALISFDLTKCWQKLNDFVYMYMYTELQSMAKYIYTYTGIVDQLDLE